MGPGEPDPKTESPEDLTGILPAPAPKPAAPSFGRYFRFLKGKEAAVVEEYDFDRHGTLVEADLTDNYEHIDEYWVDKGRSLVVIALNKKNNLNEYLLFEPSLSEFEYELLERLHEDLRDVLILTSEEIRKDHRVIIL